MLFIIVIIKASIQWHSIYQTQIDSSIKKTINRFLTDIGYQQNMSGGRHLGTITIKTNIFIDKAASTHVIDFQATKVMNHDQEQVLNVSLRL